MARKDRNTLKGFFKNGNNPTQTHFADLIDSTINKIDDGFIKDVDEGLKLSPLGNSKNLMSFSKDSIEKTPDWKVAINPEEKAEGLAFVNNDNQYRLFLGQNGNVGVGTPYPRASLDVKGTSTLATRTGGHLVGKVKADGAWHVLVDKLTDCQSFEIVAKVEGRSKRGQTAMAHAIAISTYGRRSRIKVTESHLGMFWNKIRFRWRGNEKNFRLEMKTGTNYGSVGEEPIYIHYHIGKLWDDTMFSPQETSDSQLTDNKAQN